MTEALNFLQQLVRVVAKHFHSTPHRALNPENVLVHVRSVLDSDYALLVGGLGYTHAPTTTTWGGGARVEYLAPEVLRGMHAWGVGLRLAFIRIGEKIVDFSSFLAKVCLNNEARPPFLAPVAKSIVLPYPLKVLLTIASGRAVRLAHRGARIS